MLQQALSVLIRVNPWLVLQIINYKILFGTYPRPRRADEPQALSAEWDSHTAEGAALWPQARNFATLVFRPTGFACSDNSVMQY